MATFAVAIREARLAAGLTPTELARATGLRRTTLARAEAGADADGQPRQVAEKIMHAVAAACDESVSDMLERVGL